MKNDWLRQVDIDTLLRWSEAGDDAAMNEVLRRVKEGDDEARELWNPPLH